MNPIILITGAARTGKTQLAKMLTMQHNAVWINYKPDAPFLFSAVTKDTTHVVFENFPVKIEDFKREIQKFIIRVDIRVEAKYKKTLYLKRPTLIIPVPINHKELDDLDFPKHKLIVIKCIEPGTIY